MGGWEEGREGGREGGGGEGEELNRMEEGENKQERGYSGRKEEVVIGDCQ